MPGLTHDVYLYSVENYRFVVYSDHSAPDGVKEFWAFEVIFSQFTKQLYMGTKKEYAPLMEVPRMQIWMAVRLFEAGVKT